MKNVDDQKVSNVISDQAYTNICNEYINILLQYFRVPDDEINSKISDFSQRVVQLGWSLRFISTSLTEMSKLFI